MSKWTKFNGRASIAAKTTESKNFASASAATRNPQPAARKHVIPQACPVSFRVHHATWGGESATCVGRTRREGGGKRCKANFATLCLSRAIGTRAALAGQARGSLPSNRIVVATNTVQFPENRKLSEVDWSSFLCPSSNSKVDRGTEHDNEPTLPGLVGNPFRLCATNTIGHAIKLLGSLARASFLPSIG